MPSRRKLSRPSRLNGTETLCYYILAALSKVLPDRASEKLARLHCATIVLAFISVLFTGIVSTAWLTLHNHSKLELDCRTDVQCDQIRKDIKDAKSKKLKNKTAETSK